MWGAFLSEPLRIVALVGRAVIPRWRAGPIRVTHPCAGRRRRVLPRAPLPLDLHVLGLSLAFILSQDQTLRCCLSLFYFFLAVRPRAPNGAADRPRRSAWFPGTDARVWFSVYLCTCPRIDADSAGDTPLVGPAFRRAASSLSYRL